MAYQAALTVSVYDNNTVRVRDYLGFLGSYVDPNGDDPGHGYNDFDVFYKIFFTDKEDTAVYTMSAAGDGDELITETPATESGNWATDKDHAVDADGIYKAYLVTIPTYDAGDAYTTDDCVLHSSVVYQCIQGGTNKEPGVETAYWTATDASTLALILTNIGSKYYAYDTVVVTVDMDTTLSNLIYRANISNGSVNTSDWKTLWNDSEWVDALQLHLDAEAIDTLDTDEEYEALEIVLNHSRNIVNKYSI